MDASSSSSSTSRGKQARDGEIEGSSRVTVGAHSETTYK